MPYFKINHSGCCERKGLCQIRYDLYLEPEDEGYEEHYVQVSVIPEGGYLGAVDEMGMPVDQADYNAWYVSLPRVWQHNPFCCHFMQHEPDTSDADIIAEGDRIIVMAYENWKKKDLHLNQNPPVKFADPFVYKEIAKPFADMEADLIKKGTPLKDPDGTALALVTAAKVKLGMNSDLVEVLASNIIQKIKDCHSRVESIKATIDKDTVRGVR